jgi:hypothetical protein
MAGAGGILATQRQPSSASQTVDPDMLMRSSVVPLAAGVLLVCNVSFAGGIDHKIDPPQNTGIWSRSNQQAVQDLTIMTVLGGALWLALTAASGIRSGSRSTRASSAPQRPPS